VDDNHWHGAVLYLEKKALGFDMVRYCGQCRTYICKEKRLGRFTLSLSSPTPLSTLSLHFVIPNNHIIDACVTNDVKSSDNLLEIGKNYLLQAILSNQAQSPADQNVTQLWR